MKFSCRYCHRTRLDEDELAPGYTNIKNRSGRCRKCKTHYQIQRELGNRVRNSEEGVMVCHARLSAGCGSLQTKKDNKQRERTSCRFCGSLLLFDFKDLTEEEKKEFYK